MTDAERIAEYLKTTVRDIERCLSEPAHRASSIHVRELAAMLSDVRREENEACAEEVRKEIQAAKGRVVRGNTDFAQTAKDQILALSWALKHIKARGHE